MTIRFVIVGMLGLAAACQFDKPCGDDPYMYQAGLCLPIPEPEKDASTDEEDSGPPGEGGAGGAAQYCKANCDLIGACLADGDFGTFLAPQLEMLGFEGNDRTGCVSYCEDHSSGEGDEEALACIADAESTAMCSGADISDSVNATNVCCKDRADSEYCVELCKALKTQDLAYGMVAATCDGVLE